MSTSKFLKVLFLFLLFLGFLMLNYSHKYRSRITETETMENIEKLKQVPEGPSPVKVLYYSLCDSSLSQPLPFKESNWTSGYQFDLKNYLLKTEGIVDSKISLYSSDACKYMPFIRVNISEYFPINITQVYLAIFVYPSNTTLCIREFENLKAKITQLGFKEFQVPKEISSKETPHERIIKQALFTWGNDTVYVECSHFLSYNRIIILKGKEEDVVRLASVMK
ncbi:hypothetical protein E3E31_05525 [Thermococcus sp. M39]|uniref:hypothetical protein n=1 Tax=unclassified Thermococcus TaxID=2627626 RepID=UPI00143B1566|nr:MULTISPECIES: hypothetical protein [unclassified Thermococcus]NJE07986.1 hypothetical protein [Thermococcus sp. M39]NJE13687.1 hypothetical protein [Thermococcus sp. LS2]